MSVLSNLNRIIEKALYDRLKRYVEHFKKLCPLLFGFREKSLTMHAYISNTESICESIDNNEFGCGIFIDLKKGLESIQSCNSNN